ncbi:MAG: MATE family efflux transporter, partial [Bacteroidota bacterium]
LAGLEEYGFFALAWMGLLLMSSLQQAFIQAPMMSLGPKKSEAEKASYFPASQFLQIGFAALIFLLISPVIAQADLILPEWKVSELFPILPLAILAYLMQEYYRRYFFINSQAAYALIIDGISYLGMLAGILILYSQDRLISSNIYAVVLISFGSAAVLGFILAKLSLKKGVTGFSSILREHWNYASWLLGTALLQFFSSNYFLLAAAALLGPLALGALRIAQNLLGLTHVLFQAMENVVPVKAAESYAKEGFSAMKKYLLKLSFRSGMVVLGILLALALSARIVLSLVYGAEYESYAYLLIGYCLFYLSLFPGYPLRYALRSIEHTRPIFISYVFSTVFSLLLAFPMVKRWELLGVVAGLILTQILMQSVYLLSLRKFQRKALAS